MSEPPFSVLLPVYRGDDPSHFRRAFESVTVDQHLPPSEVVIVRDGPVDPALESELRAAEAGPVAVTVIRGAENAGLARALNLGLAACRHSIVARMDADDVSLPQRFAVQIPALTELGVDLLGAGLWEMEGDDEVPSRVRIPPLTEDEIRRAARFRQPFHHPTVVYRRDAVQRAGGYRSDVGRFEDYLLFATMLARGAKTANLAEPLVFYRVGAGAYARRGGLDHFRNEIRLQRELRALGVINRAEVARNLVARGAYRLVPTGVRERLYRRFASAPAR